MPRPIDPARDARAATGLPAAAGPFGRALQRVVRVRPDEIGPMLLAAAWFFLLLASYAVLRPIRDAMAVAGDVRNIPWLWSGTFVMTLLASPLFAWAVSRFPRRRFVPGTYHVVALNLAAFFALWQSFPADGAARIWLGRVFYVWVSVYVMFVVSVLWSVLTDLFRREQGARLFGFIAVGATCGKICGASLTVELVGAVGTGGMLLIAAALLELGVVFARRLMAGNIGAERAEAGADDPPGRGVLHGALRIVRSPYLLGISLYVFLLTYPPTFAYLEKARLVADLFDTRVEQTRFFAEVDRVTDVVTLLLQAFVTGRLMRRVGVGFTLGALPVLCVLGFTGLGLGSLGIVPLLFAVVGFDIAVNAGRHALARPSREVLFTIASREEKYASKNFVDTAVYRGGDVVNAFVHGDVIRALLPKLSAVAFAAVPIALIWTALAWLLGRAERRRAAAHGIAAAPPGPATRATR